MERYSASEQETEAIGREMAQQLAPGAVVAFTGDLGAGKTAFVRGMAQGLGISQRVTSPTFTIVNEYEGGTLPLFHFDMYRLRDADDLFDIGWGDYLDRGGVCVRGGLHCAPLAHKKLGTLERGAVRVSVGMFNTQKQMEKLAYLLKKII